MDDRSMIETGLMRAAADGDMAGVRQWLDARGHVDAVDHDGVTALHHACYAQQYEVVELLLANGADAGRRDPTHGADAAGWLDQGVFDGGASPAPVAELLIAAGVDVDVSRCVVFDLPARLAALLEEDRQPIADRPLLHDAVFLDRTSCVNVLLDAGASRDATFPSHDDLDYHVTPVALADRLGRSFDRLNG